MPALQSNRSKRKFERLRKHENCPAGEAPRPTPLGLHAGRDTMCAMVDPDIMPDGFEREREATHKALWQCLAAFIVLLVLTIISHARPHWVQDALGGATVLALILFLIGLQEAWKLRRGRPPF